uniref:Uncharacterized protein n=1 Tax=Pararge aegeria TaxID=116150 RepID=S4P3A9_9NEOP
MLVFTLQLLSIRYSHWSLVIKAMSCFSFLDRCSQPTHTLQNNINSTLKCFNRLIYYFITKQNMYYISFV